jgi:hypothetical protein
MIAGFVFVLLVGLVLIAVGVRGRFVGDALYCRGCGFDLSGLLESKTDIGLRRVAGEPACVCPECGSKIVETDDARVGQRVRRRWVIVAGAVLLIVVVAPLGAGLYKSGGKLNWLRMKPNGWVLADALRYESSWKPTPRQTGRTNENLVELFRREQAGDLNDEFFIEAAMKSVELRRAWADGVDGSVLAVGMAGGAGAVGAARWSGGSGWSWGAGEWSRLGPSTSVSELEMLALRQRLLSREEKRALLESAVHLTIEPTRQLVRGDALSLKMVVSFYASSRGSSQADLLVPGALEYVFVEATIDGVTVSQAKVADGMDRYARIYPTRDWTFPESFIPGEEVTVDLPPGVYEVELVLRAFVKPKLQAWANPGFVELIDEMEREDGGLFLRAKTEIVVVED